MAISILGPKPHRENGGFLYLGPIRWYYNAVLKLGLLCINSSLTRIPTINYNVALNLINSQQLSQNYFLTAIAAKFSNLGLHCSLLGKASLT